MQIKYTSILPDLLRPEDEPNDRAALNGCPEKKKVRIQISFTDEGIEILGDCMYEIVLEQLLEKLDVKEMEKMLCG